MIPMGLNPKDFDVARWMHEHGYDSIPVGQTLFIVPVVDGASGGDFLVIGVGTQTDEGEEQTVVIAMDEEFAALVAANLARRVGFEKMTMAALKVRKADDEARARDAAEGVRQDDGVLGLPSIPPSQEVIEQMIKDDLDKNKDGY